MRGAKIQYKKLGGLLKAGREASGMSLREAALMIGIFNESYLSRCEGGTDNFPLNTIKRAADLYGIAGGAVLEAVLEDYKEGMQEALK